VTGTATLAFGAGARRGGAQPAWNGTTCASTYCHGGTLDAGGSSQEPRWTGGAAEAACGTCHGVPPPAPHTTSTACGGCHPGYTSTTVAVATHIDGTVQVVSVHGAGWRAKEQHGYAANREGLGGCKSCHGAALDGVGGSGPSCTSCHQAAGFASWATTCTFCHGDRTSGLASPPVDTQGRSVTTNVSVGNHASHLGTTLMTGMACTQCHPDRAGSNVIADSAHVDGNGVAEVSFGALARTGGASATYTRSSSTSASCSATYCHGSFTGGTSATVGWTSAVQVGCTSCHGAPPSTGKHGNHSGRSCGDCHPGYTRTSVNVATHLDGAREVGNLVKSWNPSTRTCVPCHVGSDTTW
jgi:predicted CxxxxCH...CXXCH cytochrome family protein